MNRLLYTLHLVHQVLGTTRQTQWTTGYEAQLTLGAHTVGPEVQVETDLTTITRLAPRDETSRATGATIRATGATTRMTEAIEISIEMPDPTEVSTLFNPSMTIFRGNGL